MDIRKIYVLDPAAHSKFPAGYRQLETRQLYLLLRCSYDTTRELLCGRFTQGAQTDRDCTSYCPGPLVLNEMYHGRDIIIPMPISFHHLSI